MKAGWETAVLGDVCEMYQPKTITGKEMIDGGPYPVFGANGIIGRYDKYNHAEPQILITCRGATCGSVNISEPNSWITGNAMVVRPRDTTIDPRFLEYYFRGGVNISKAITGAAQPQITRTNLEPLEICFPNSIQEQHRIVTILDEAFDGIATAKANAEKNLQNARAIFESHLHSVFKQRGDGWAEMTLGEIGKVSMCKRIFKEETKTTGDIPFYKIGSFGKTADSFISSEIYRQYRERYPFPNKGDVLVSAAGTIGRRVIYDGEDAYFQDSNIVWISNDQNRVLNHYLYHFYGACEWNSTKGATIARLYNDNLKRIVIGFPKSLYEQQCIADQLDVIFEEANSLIVIYKRKLAALDDLKKSLLNQAFSGLL